MTACAAAIIKAIKAIKAAVQEIGLTTQPETSPETELTLEQLISRVWSNDPQNLRTQLTERECQAVELYVSRTFTDPSERQLLLRDGLLPAILMVWAAPLTFGAI